MADYLQVSQGGEMSTEDAIKLWKLNDLQLSYTPGMQTDRVSEAVKGAVPIGQNTPQVAPFKLYAEQLSGTSFTTPRVDNKRNYNYRILPTVRHSRFTKLSHQNDLLINDFSKENITPQRMRWNPIPISKHPTKFYEGLVTFAGAGSPESKQGMAVHLYQCNQSMINESFCNADGDLLIVPQKGDLLIRTEYGFLEIPNGFIGVIQRGIHFSVLLKEESRGYIAEVYESHFVIPDLGPIGANGLANPRDFETCVSSFEQKSMHNKFKIIQKFCGKLFCAERESTMYDIVGWHGNYVPFRYDLSKFCTINSVSFDHIDPSIFTVLTAPTPNKGVACCDFVIFPPRWSVHTNTFRPPYYHRNTMSEYMGNIYGIYEAKRKGFQPGGGSLHSCMSAHGPDAETFEIASKEKQVPVPPKENALAFMFESCYIFRLTDYALEPSLIQNDYSKCWKPLKQNFTLKSKL